MKFVHDRYILHKSFEVGQNGHPLQFPIALFLGKLHSRWSGPFVVRHISSHRAIEIQNPRNRNVFKVNGHRLKLYLDLEMREVEFVDLHDPPPIE